MKTLQDLNHISKNTYSGAEVYLLDTGSVINPESEAMLQALHSRSVGGIKHHLKVLDEKGSEDFMNNFYVGYNHKSIGDCGSITLFVEGVSMLAAKSIQDSKLYSGQEASTRYIDFSKQEFINPLHRRSKHYNEFGEILESQREFYLSALEPTKQLLKEQHPRQEGESEKEYGKAINARAFDVTRGFLPAGASTNLAWHGNLRQVADRLLFLRHHPLAEVRDIADTIEDAVIEGFPSSFLNKKGEKVRYVLTEEYQNLIAKDYYYSEPNQGEIEIDSNILSRDLKEFKELINSRPSKTELPKYLSHLGHIKAKFLLDFGSFRDIQRHRSIDQRMPLLTTFLGFNEWYLDNLPEDTKRSAEDFLINLENKIIPMEDLNLNWKVKQYLTPMGYNTSNLIQGDLPSMVYVAELRSTRFIHPTLRKVAREIGEYIQNNLNVKIHFDEDPDRFDIKRGEQDIEIK